MKNGQFITKSSFFITLKSLVLFLRSVKTKNNCRAERAISKSSPAGNSSHLAVSSSISLGEAKKQLL